MEVLVESAKQIPALVVLVLLVHWFLMHLREERSLIEKIQASVNSRDDSIFNDYKHQSESVSLALGRSIQIIEKMERRFAD